MSDRSAKSFWICCAASSVLALLATLALPQEAEAKEKVRSREELTNFLLDPEHSLWLVGPIARIASESEIERYLRLTTDEEAAAFIDEFWASRRGESGGVWPAEQPQAIYETRARQADALYGEGARAGRRSDRGTIYILYGEPAEVKFEISSRPDRGPIEVWVYPKDAEEGLDGERPKRYYYFVKRGEYTVETGAPSRQRLRRGAFSG